MSRRVAGRFTELRRLGEGGMGSVSLAHDHATGAACALKRVHVAEDPRAVARLQAEFAALSRVRHPALVEVRDLVFERGASPILVMEFVPGLPADQVIPKGDVDALVRMAISACEGLAALHDAGVVHGDLKPANLLVLPEAPEDVRLVDLGLAALEGHERPSFAGTPGYAASELRRGEPAAPASDLFALGATLHALITGSLPRASRSGELSGESGEMPSDARALERSGAPPALVSLILQLMARAPAERPRDARTVVRALSRIAPEARPTLSARLDTMRFVGRGRETERILAVHRRSRRGPRRVLLLGEAGVGKSALLDAVAMQLRLEGVCVAQLSAGDSALHVLAVTLSAAAGAAPPEALGAWLDDPSVPLAPEALESLPRWIASCCSALADEGRPPAILVDDLDRRDASTRTALRRLALMPECRALHVWAASRVDAPTVRLVQAGEMLRLPLGALDPGSRRQFVSSRLGASAPDALFADLERDAEGHPGRLLARLRAVVGSGALSERDGSLVLAPEVLGSLAPSTLDAAALEARWEGLPGAGEVVLALALAPRALDAPALLVAAPGTPASTLAALLSRRVLRSSGGLHRLASPALSEAWMRGQPDSERERMRRRLLAHAGLTPVERFHLLVELGDDEAALALAGSIAESHAEGGIAREAARVADRSGSALACLWHLRAAREARRTGRYAEAAREFDQAASQAEGDDWFEAAEGALVSRNRVGESDGLLERCEATLAAGPGARWRAAILLVRASLEWARGLTDQAFETLAEARTAAATTGSIELRARVGQLEAHMLLEAGHAAEALAAADATASLGAGDPSPELLRVEAVAGLALHQIGRSAEGLERMTRARQRAIERGADFVRLDLLQMEGPLRIECGEWASARSLYEQALHLALALDLARAAAVSATNLLMSAALTGDLSAFLRRQRRVARFAKRWSESAHLDLTGRVFALADLARGRPSSARRRLERSLADMRVRTSAPMRRWSLLALAQAEDECGSPERAAPVLDEIIREGGHDLLHALALARRGLLHARLDHANEAAADLEQLEGMDTSRWGQALAHMAALRAACSILRQDAAAADAAAIEMERRFEALPAPHELAMASLALTELALRVQLTAVSAPLWIEQARGRAERLQNPRAQILALELSERWARMTAPTQHSPEDVTWLAEVSVMVQHTSHLHTFAQRAMAIVCRRLESERGVLVLADRVGPAPGSPDRAPFHVVGTFGAIDDDAKREALGYSRKVVQFVVQSGRGVRNSDVTRDPQMISKSLMDMRVRSVLCVPLFVSGRPIGAVYLHDRSRAKDFSDQDTARLEAFARIMAAAIELNWKQAATQEEHDRLVTEHVSLKRSTGARFEDALLIGSHDSMQRVNELVELVAHRDSMVLITGESGTGKDLVARSIHAKSPRRDGPFISTNCGALPQTMIESELFGIMPDVATGVNGRPGMFERASGGTLFLDEIAEMPLEQQVTLLRVLQTREVTPIGADHSIAVDVRVLAATNQDLEKRIQEGRFRSDLYFRLNVVPIHMPPLRERRSDLPALARHLAAQIAVRFERAAPRLSEQFLGLLMEHSWPGNVRELENQIERAMLMDSGDVLDPPPDLRLQRERRFPDGAGATPNSLDELLEQIRRDRILAALDSCEGNQSKAARALGMGEAKLRFWMRRLGLRPVRNI